MRVRTEARRDAIVETAARLFRQAGYERTSMAMISTQLGGSKATLYGYFPSKEALFAAVIARSAQQELDPALDDLETSTADPRVRLQRFGEAFLSFLFKPETVAGQRMVIAEAGQSDVGKTLYENGPKRVEARVATLLAGWMKKGDLRRADPRVATLQLIALIEAESVLPNLLGLTTNWSKQEVVQMVRRAVSTFMLAYADPS